MKTFAHFCSPLQLIFPNLYFPFSFPFLLSGVVFLCGFLKACRSYQRYCLHKNEGKYKRIDY